MTLRVVLICDECGATVTPCPWFMLTKTTVFRLQGSSHGFYIDGGKVLCPEHLPDPMPSSQVDTWTKYDRRAVEDDQAEEAWLDEIVKRNPGLERSA